jgi:hypothetical protein
MNLISRFEPSFWLHLNQRTIALTIHTSRRLIMQFHKLVINATLATLALSANQPAATAGLPSSAKQFELQTVQPKLQAESISPHQARQTFFNHPPQLIRAAASQIGEDSPSTYEFTLTVPPDAGQPLQAVTIAQVENLETVKFDVSTSKAFIGERLTASSEIRLASIGGSQPTKPGEVSIVFDQPVQPGNKVTVALSVQQNPRFGGVYLFGVTAHPAGANSLGQFLGFGRITFYAD